jgi:signal transduction histidine kinase
VQPGLELPAELERLVYRAAQEGVRNVLKHAEARTLEVEVRASAGKLHLYVRDDGQGFRVRQQDPAHFGLRLLSESAEAHRGRLSVTSVPGAGTTVHLEVQIR